MTMTGECFALMTAAIWAGVAALYARAAEQRLSMAPFVAVTTTTASLLAIAVVARAHAVFTQGAGWPLIAIMIVYGIAGQVSMLYGGKAMSVHPSKSAVSWFVLQMAMVVPFLGSVFLWGERAAPHRWLALPLLALALFLFSAPTPSPCQDDGTRSARWAPLLLWAFVLSGVSQLASQVPSVFRWDDAGNLRVPLSLGAAALFLWGVCGLTRQWPRGAHWRWGILTGFVVMSGNVTLFKALDLLAPAGQAYLVYPIAVAGSVILFSILRGVSRKETFSVRAGIGMAVGTLGLVLLAW